MGLLVGLLVGIIPAVRSWEIKPGVWPERRNALGKSRARNILSKSLVVTQVALSLVLLSSAALFVRYLVHLEHMDLGFRHDHVLLVTLDPQGSGYEGKQLARAYQQLLARLESIPGVSSASLCSVSPIQGAGANRGVNVEGYVARPGSIRNVMENWIAPNYFRTLGTPLLAE